MAITGNQPAYTQARSGILRSGAGRAGWYVYNLLVTLTRTKAEGGTETVNLLPHIHFPSLTIYKGLNDEPDTASFTLRPLASAQAVTPLAGEVIEIALGSSSNLIFGGQAMKVVTRYQQGLKEPWHDVFCIDWMDLLDARIVTGEYTNQSATTILTDLLSRYTTSGQFVAQFQANMPAIPTLPITNQRLSTVFRTVTGQIGGGFYIEPNRVVRAWAAGGEPQYSQPQVLQPSLKTFKNASITEDATQVRTAVVAEGKRTTTPPALPANGDPPLAPSGLYSIPVQESAFFAPNPPTGWKPIRIGTQWCDFQFKDELNPLLNPPGSTVVQAAAPGATQILVENSTPFSSPTLTYPQWASVGGQSIRYAGAGYPSFGWLSGIPASGYGSIQSPISVGTEITVMPTLGDVYGFDWGWSQAGYIGREAIRAQDPGQAVVSMYREQRAAAITAWQKRCYLSNGIRETIVQDGRWSYAGMQTRAKVELDMFESPYVVLDWETDDMNADVGRLQATALPDTTQTFLITTVTLTFLLNNKPPRRTCHGVERTRSEATSLLDVLLTEVN